MAVPPDDIDKALYAWDRLKAMILHGFPSVAGRLAYLRAWLAGGSRSGGK